MLSRNTQKLACAFTITNMQTVVCFLKNSFRNTLRIITKVSDSRCDESQIPAASRGFEL